MGVNGPVDVKGVPLQEGQLVCYTTNSRGSGLQFGTVRKIYEKTETRRQYDYRTRSYTNPVPVTSYRVSFNVTDVDGKPRMQTEYDSTIPNPESYNGFGKHVETDNQVVSGIIDYQSNKFLIL